LTRKLATRHLQKLKDDTKIEPVLAAPGTRERETPPDGLQGDGFRLAR
jgi:hypothetical protein